MKRGKKEGEGGGGVFESEPLGCMFWGWAGKEEMQENFFVHVFKTFLWAGLGRADSAAAGGGEALG